MAVSTMHALQHSPVASLHHRSAGRQCQPRVRFVHPARMAPKRVMSCHANNFRNGGGFGPFLWGVAPGIAGKTVAQLLTELEQNFERQQQQQRRSDNPASDSWTSASDANQYANQGQRRSGHRYRDAWQTAMGPLALPVDIQEYEDKYTLLADIPGLTKDDLKIQINQTERTLTISGERKRPAEQEEPAQRHASSRFMKRQFERRHGEFSRKFNLADNADLDAISARVDRGVLTLTVGKAKKEEEAPKDDVKEVKIDI